MITINKDSENKIVVTVSQDANINYTYYLFEFTSLMSAEKVVFLGQDTSEHPERYNLFVVNEKKNPNLENGEVELQEGDYIYAIYGKYVQDLTIPNPTSILEHGYARIQVPYVYSETNSEYTNIGYDPDSK